MWDADAGMLCVCVCVIVTQDLRNVEHMYQFSLTSFIALFSRTLRKPMDAKSIDARISALVRPPPAHHAMFLCSMAACALTIVRWLDLKQEEHRVCLRLLSG